jgi:hypothetical protein
MSAKRGSDRRARMIMIDWDSKKFSKSMSDDFTRFSQILFPGVRWKSYHLERSPSGKGWHFYIEALNRDRLCPFRTILLQCLLGSDIGRERANIDRLGQKVKDWNRLFSTKRMLLYPKRL